MTSETDPLPSPRYPPTSPPVTRDQRINRIIVPREGDAEGDGNGAGELGPRGADHLEGAVSPFAGSEGVRSAGLGSPAVPRTPRGSSAQPPPQPHPVVAATADSSSGERSGGSTLGGGSTARKQRPTSATKSYASSISVSSFHPSSSRIGSRLPTAMPYAIEGRSSHQAPAAAQGRESTPNRNSTSVPLSAGARSVGGGTRTTPSRFLLTVVPPLHLPHDPPHPRTSAACSGYGPPDKFRRGTLIPLYPTLSSQLGAIAREYGLPSTGGLVVYLVSTSDPNSSRPSELPGSSGLAGVDGPRIGPEAWNLLWGKLFEVEEEDHFERNGSSTDDDESNPGAPPVPPIPQTHRYNLSSLHNLHENGLRSAYAAFPNPYSELRPVEEHFRGSSDGEAEGASLSSEAGESVYSNIGPAEPIDLAPATSQVRQAANLIDERHNNSQNSTPPPRDTSSSIVRGINSAPNSISSRVPPPSTSTSKPARPLASLSTLSTLSNPNLRQASRGSVLSTRSVPATPLGRQSGPSLYSNSPRRKIDSSRYGPALVVGKVEFDIDWKRGGRSKWYEGWLEAARTPGSETTPAYSVENSIYVGSGPTTAATERFHDILEEGGLATVRPQELHLPGLVSQRRRQEEKSELGAEDAFEEPAGGEDHFQKTPEKWVRSVSASNGSGGKSTLDPEAAPYVFSPSTVEDDSTRRYEPTAAMPRSSSLQNANGVLSPPLGSASPRGDGYELLATEAGDGYEHLDDEDDFDGEGTGEGLQELQRSEDNTEEEEEYNSLPLPSPTLLIPFIPINEDPLGDVFPSDEATWSQMKTVPKVEEERRDLAHEEKLVSATGLGIFGARVEDLSSMAPPGVLETSKKESFDEAGLPPPQDDVADVVAMLQPGTKTDKINLASPIHLTSSPSAPAEGFVAPRQIEEPIDITAPLPPQVEDSFANDASSRDTTASFRSPSSQRKGSHDWANSPGANKVLAIPSPVIEQPQFQYSDNLQSPDIGDDARRASTIGLMENLDDLERALAELSPRAKRTTASRAPSGDLFSPSPHSASSALPKSRAGSDAVSAVNQPPYRTGPPPLTSEVAGYSANSVLEQNAPVSPVIPFNVSSEALAVSNDFDAVTPKGSPSTRSESTTSRTPRSTSLSRRVAPPVGDNTSTSHPEVEMPRPPPPATNLNSEPPLIPEPVRSASPGRKSRSSKSSSRRGSEPSDKESPKEKSSFFQKPAFKFFRKSEGSPDSSTSPLASPNPPSIEAFPPPSEQALARVTSPPVPTSAPISRDAHPSRPGPPAGAPSFPPHSATGNYSFPHSRTTGESTRDYQSSTTPRAARSSLPRETSSFSPSTSNSNTRSSLPREGASLNPPSFNYREMMASSASSPNGGYPLARSAPATPQSQSSASQRPKRLATEMDNLLSQMSEIDFGEDDSTGGTEESTNSVAPRPFPKGAAQGK